jgi:hypothetical protein
LYAGERALPLGHTGGAGLEVLIISIDGNPQPGTSAAAQAVSTLLTGEVLRPTRGVPGQ